MNALTDLLLGVGQPRVSHFPDLCTLLYTYLSTLDYWTKIVYYLFTQTAPVAHTSALTPTYIKSQKLPNWPISKELGLGRMLLPHWKLLFYIIGVYRIAGARRCCYFADLWSYFKPCCIMIAALFWCAYTARGISEYIPITCSWFAAELFQCLDKMADVNSVVNQRWFD